MRQIATLPDGDAAQTLADYLLTLQIKTQVKEQPDGWAVWACDEDRVPQARAEAAEFRRDPNQPRFAQAARAARQLRRQEVAEENDYLRRQAEFRQKMREPAAAPRYLTALLMAASVVVALLSNFGKQLDPGSFASRLLITADPHRHLIGESHLAEIARGEVWRLITPIFIHLDIPHLLFNLIMLYDLGGRVEQRRGTLRLAVLVLVFAVASNLAQFYLGDIRWTAGGLVFITSGKFGGLSGVLYGLFGYLWMKSRYEPNLGLELSSSTVVILLLWFFVSMTGLVGPIANAAHAAGLAVGLVVGVAPHLWRRLRR